MPIVRHGEPLNVLVAVKGHPFDRSAFGAIFDEMEGVAAAIVDQPAAARLMTPAGMAGFDALVLYDMPGIDFRAPGGPRFPPPDDATRAGLLALLDAGVPIVALHHAIAGWPAWPEYAEILGGRFLYRPGVLRGVERPDSGYRHDVSYVAEAAQPGHPILAGLPTRLKLKDELYLFEVFEDSVQPLLRARHAFVRDSFFSAAQAVAGRMYSNEGWEHPPGSDLVGWTKRARRSPLVYLQPGDGPATYARRQYRRLILNAIRWAASPAAREWAVRG
ncbi:MAG TPA: ThuA domain-containing protein [Caulobacteraceae bacterium]|nr:ThuA domain-containing protein [Caulobacteraceae bacterium]